MDKWIDITMRIGLGLHCIYVESFTVSVYVLS